VCDDGADIAVVDVPVVVVFELHDAIADAEGEGFVRDGLSVWVEFILQDSVEALDPAGILPHGAQDLDIVLGIEIKALWDFFADELLDEIFGVIWGGGLDEEEFAVCGGHVFL